MLCLPWETMNRQIDVQRETTKLKECIFLEQRDESYSCLAMRLNLNHRMVNSSMFEILFVAKHSTPGTLVARMDMFPSERLHWKTMSIFGAPKTLLTES